MVQSPVMMAGWSGLRAALLASMSARFMSYLHIIRAAPVARRHGSV
jgi:hypothetical protein